MRELGLASVRADRHNGVAYANRTAFDDGGAEPAAPAKIAEQAGTGELLEVGAGVTVAYAAEPGFADGELDADEGGQVHAARDDVAAHLRRLQAHLLRQLLFHERDLLIGPAGIAPEALPGYVAIARDAGAGDELDRLMLLHGRARASGREEHRDLSVGICHGVR